MEKKETYKTKFSSACIAEAISILEKKTNNSIKFLTLLVQLKLDNEHNDTRHYKKFEDLISDYESIACFGAWFLISGDGYSLNIMVNQVFNSFITDVTAEGSSRDDIQNILQIFRNYNFNNSTIKKNEIPLKEDKPWLVHDIRKVFTGVAVIVIATFILYHFGLKP